MVKQGVARLFVYEFPKSTTERRQKLCIKVIVFKNNYMNICLDFVYIEILFSIRITILSFAETDEKPFIIMNKGFCCVLHIYRLRESRQRGLCSHFTASVIFYFLFNHKFTSLSRHIKLPCNNLPLNQQHVFAFCTHTNYI